MDDLIKREAVLDYMKGWKGDTVNFVRNLPAVDAAPVVHGRWIVTNGMKPPEYHHLHQCSVCEIYALRLPPYGNREALSPWCPACGAKMDLEETK